MRTWDQNRTFSIPEILRNCKQWITWGKGKRPHNAKVNDPDTWKTFTDACKEYAQNESLYGIGFVFNGNGVVGIDLDNVMVDEKLNDETANLLKEIDSYTEVSPSGKGVHCFVLGRMKGAGVKQDGIEMYDRGRYFTVTGDAMFQFNADLQNRQRLIDKYSQTKMAEPDANFDYYIKDNPEPPYGKMDALKDALGKPFLDTLNRKRKDLTDSSMSGYDLALANFAYQAEWSDQEIVDLLVWFRKKHGGKTKHVDYYRRTLVRLRSFNKQDFAKKNPESGRDLVSSTLGMDIEHIMQVGEKNAKWYIKLQSRKVPYEIGATKEFIRRATWECVVVELTGKQLAVSKKDWPKFAQLMLDVSVKQELDDAEEMAVIDDYIDEYLESRQNSPCSEEDEDEFTLAYIDRKPFLDKDGELNFTAGSLHRWILVEHGFNYGQAALATRLKAIGYLSKQVARRVEGRVIKRRYWRRIHTES